MLKIWVLFLASSFLSTICSEDLYSGLLEDIEHGQHLQIGDGPRIIYSDENPQEQFVKRSLHEARLLQLRLLQSQIATLDDAVTLPKALAEKRRDQQKKLSRLRNTIASRVVDSVAQQKIEDLVPGKQGITQASQFVHYQARKYLEQIPKSERESFKESWKAALVDGKVRQDFANLLAMGSLYGRDNALVKKATEQIYKHGQSFAKNVDENPVMLRSQAVLYLQNLLKPHKAKLPQSLSKRFQSIALFEQKLLETTDSREKRLVNRKLEWERERLLQALVSMGVADPGKEIDLQSLEEEASEFLKDNLLEKESLGYPFRPKAEVTHPFVSDEPFTGFEVSTDHEVLAMIKGMVMTAEAKRITLQSMHYYIVYEGDFQHKLKRSQNVQAGQKIGMARNGEIRIEVYDLSLGNQAVNCLAEQKQKQ